MKKINEHPIVSGKKRGRAAKSKQVEGQKTLEIFGFILSKKPSLKKIVKLDPSEFEDHLLTEEWLLEKEYRMARVCRLKRQFTKTRQDELSCAKMVVGQGRCVCYECELCEVLPSPDQDKYMHKECADTVEEAQVQVDSADTGGGGVVGRIEVVKRREGEGF